MDPVALIGHQIEFRLAIQMGIAEADARWLFQQLIIAVDYCHRLGIANRDIKVRENLSLEHASSRTDSAAASGRQQKLGLQNAVYSSQMQLASSVTSSLTL